MVQLRCSHSESPPHLSGSPVWKEAHHSHKDFILCVRLHSLFGGAGVEKHMHIVLGVMHTHPGSAGGTHPDHEL